MVIATDVILLVYSLGQSNIINSPMVQQGQMNVTPYSQSSFQFGQPAKHILYVNFTMPENTSLHYTLYEMPSYQVAFYSGGTYDKYTNYYLHATHQLKLYQQPLSKLTLLRSGNVTSGSTIVLNKASGTLGEEYLLNATASGNSSFTAHISATTNFRLLENADRNTGIAGGISLFSGLFVLAVGLTRMYGNNQ